MKDLSTVIIDATRAQKLVDEAKTILTDSKVSKRVLTSNQVNELWWILDQADARLSGLLTYVHMLPTEMGRKGGQKTAERGPDYFRQLAAMRKNRSGGRPKKSEQTAQSTDSSK